MRLAALNWVVFIVLLAVAWIILRPEGWWVAVMAAGSAAVAFGLLPVLATRRPRRSI